MKCTKARKLLIGEMCEALEGQVSEALRSHLESCDQCREQLREIRSLGELFASARPPVADARPDLWERVEAEIERTENSRRRFQWLPIFWRLGTASAAAALVVVAFSVTLSPPKSSAPEIEPTATQPPQAVQPKMPTAPPPPAKTLETSISPKPAQTASAAESRPPQKAPKRKVTRARPAAAKRTSQPGSYRYSYGRGETASTPTASAEKLAAYNLGFEAVDFGLADAGSSNGDGGLWDDSRELYARAAEGVSRSAASPSSPPARAEETNFLTTDGATPPDMGMEEHTSDRDWYFDRAGVALADRVEAKYADRIMEEKARAVEMVYTSADSRARTLFSY